MSDISHKESQGDFKRGEESIRRAFSLRRILREQFAIRGTMPVQKDADLSTKWSEETLKVLEASGASGPALQRQVQLFASVTLLEMKVGHRPKPEELVPFLKNTMGENNAQALTREDWNALNAAREKMSALISEPRWSQVHGGHIAMSCLTLLSLYDVSVLNISYPG